MFSFRSFCILLLKTKQTKNAYQSSNLDRFRYFHFLMHIKFIVQSFTISPFITKIGNIHNKIYQKILMQTNNRIKREKQPQFTFKFRVLSISKSWKKEEKKNTKICISFRIPFQFYYIAYESVISSTHLWILKEMCGVGFYLPPPHWHCNNALNGQWRMT